MGGRMDEKGVLKFVTLWQIAYYIYYWIDVRPAARLHSIRTTTTKSIRTTTTNFIRTTSRSIRTTHHAAEFLQQSLSASARLRTLILTKQASPININIANNSHNAGNNIQSNNPRDLGCPFCGCQTQTVFMKKAGNVTYLWCFCLFILTTGILCCVPFCIDSCKDTHLVCVRCKNSK